MTQTARKRELGRGERVLPGVWRLRLPLPWPGVPHGNAWALAAGDGIVLVDTGIHEPGSMDQLVRALDQVNLKLEHIKLLVCTHAHSDHYGQAASIVDATGCELWMHPNYEEMLAHADDADGALNRRIEIALQSGVPEEPLRKFMEERKRDNPGIARVIAARPPARARRRDRDGPRHVDRARDARPRAEPCLPVPARPPPARSAATTCSAASRCTSTRLLPRPGRRVPALPRRRRGLDARLCLAGHGRTFSDLQAHIEANRYLVHERLDAVRVSCGEQGPISPFDAASGVYGDASSTSRRTGGRRR